ncbi:DUF5694 domain-containing protein [Luteimonas sp. SMYT11W]|uniref:DUF5694 domain-containing protein n=1 Tax=Luteimonas flava TaxID=3115822 RepID=A0ABU7WD01_9GAMM
MSSRLPCAALLLTTAAMCADAHAAAPSPEPAKVMMLGVFHFENPGLDVVKSEVVDVTTDDNQAYLIGLATRIAAFHPTDVLVECEPSAQPVQDAAYAAWRDGTAALTVDETQQIGFRVAKAAGLPGVTCFDEGDVHWNGEPLFAYVGAHAPAQKVAMDAVFAALSARTTREQTTLPLHELLRLTNDAERDRENKDLYLFTNAVDAGGSFVGADASASWWHRNFRMYANVQKAAAPGHRVLVIAGAGHTAILKDLLAIDGARQAEDVTGYLMP